MPPARDIMLESFGIGKAERLRAKPQFTAELGIAAQAICVAKLNLPTYLNLRPDSYRTHQVATRMYNLFNEIEIIINPCISKAVQMGALPASVSIPHHMDTIKADDIAQSLFYLVKQVNEQEYDDDERRFISILLVTLCVCYYTISAVSNAIILDYSYVYTCAECICFLKELEHILVHPTTLEEPDSYGMKFLMPRPRINDIPTTIRILDANHNTLQEMIDYQGEPFIIKNGFSFLMRFEDDDVVRDNIMKFIRNNLTRHIPIHIGIESSESGTKIEMIRLHVFLNNDDDETPMNLNQYELRNHLDVSEITGRLILPNVFNEDLELNPEWTIARAMWYFDEVSNNLEDDETEIGDQYEIPLETWSISTVNTTAPLKCVDFLSMVVGVYGQLYVQFATPISFCSDSNGGPQKSQWDYGAQRVQEIWENRWSKRSMYCGAEVLLDHAIVESGDILYIPHESYHSITRIGPSIEVTSMLP